MALAVEDEASSAASFFIGTLNRMRMRSLDALVVVYGIFLIAMGIDGLVHGSIVSIIAGGICGILEIGFATMTKSNPRVGRIGAAVVALLMMGKFIPDAMKKQAPAAIAIAIFSVVVFLALMGGHFLAMSRKKAST